LPLKSIRGIVLKFVPEYGYNLGTPALKPYKREIKTYQKDTILRDKVTKNRTCSELEKEFESRLGMEMMGIFSDFGKIRELGPESEEAQALAQGLQAFISDHYYTCSEAILSGLGKMYAGGGEFTASIDKAGGEGTAEFANKAIQIYCGK